MSVENNDKMRDCSEFVFAVSDEELSTVPLARCMDDTGRDNITQDSIYRVSGLDESGLLIIEDDKGEECSFESGRFEFI